MGDGQAMQVSLNIASVEGFEETLRDRLDTKPISPKHRAFYEDHSGSERQALGAECVGAHAFNMRWTPKPILGSERFGQRKWGDIAPGVSVRHTKWADGHLVIQTSDQYHGAFLLVCGAEPDWTLPGWIFGWQARGLGKWQAGRYDAKHFAWWVPQGALRKEWRLFEVMAHAAVASPDLYRDGQLVGGP